MLWYVLSHGWPYFSHPKQHFTFGPFRLGSNRFRPPLPRVLALVNSTTNAHAHFYRRHYSSTVKLL